MKSIKLLKTKRYTFKDKTYFHGKTYQLNDGLANELLRKEDPHGLPYFVMSDDNPDEVMKDNEVKQASSKAKAKKSGDEGTEGVTSGDDSAVAV